MNGPQDNEDKINLIIKAWQEHAPGVEFYGLSLAVFTTAMGVALTPRAEIAKREQEIKDFAVAREDGDKVAMPLCDHIVKAVVASKDFGDNSAFYKAMGYKRKDERHTGLTRKKTPPAAP